MASKVVPQGIQNRVKKTIGHILENANEPGDFEYYSYDEETGVISLRDYDDAFPGMTEYEEYEIITVVIPKQAAHHSEVRNG